jgi:hypothetical protein
VPQPSAPPRASTGKNIACKYINAVQNKVDKDIWQNDQGIAFGNWYSFFNLGDKEDFGNGFLHHVHFRRNEQNNEISEKLIS